MELLTILFSGLLSIISSAGLVVDTVVSNALRSQFEAVEQLEVRIDNTPSYQVLQGKVGRLRIASRGVQLAPKIRIALLELETDPIELNIENLQQQKKTDLRKSFQQPLQAGVRLVLTAEDLNQALQSGLVTAWFQQSLESLSDSLPNPPDQNYELSDLRVEFLGDSRLRLHLKLRGSGSQTTESQQLDIILESGLEVVGGQHLQLIEPAASVNGKAFSSQLVAGFAEGLSNRVDLRTLEDAGITARIIKLGVDNDHLEIAAFVRVEALESFATSNRQ